MPQGRPAAGEDVSKLVVIQVQKFFFTVKADTSRTVEWEEKKNSQRPKKRARVDHSLSYSF